MADLPSCEKPAERIRELERAVAEARMGLTASLYLLHVPAVAAALAGLSNDDLAHEQVPVQYIALREHLAAPLLNFRWVVPEELCGCGRPLSRLDLLALREKGVRPGLPGPAFHAIAGYDGGERDDGHVHRPREPAMRRALTAWLLLTALLLADGEMIALFLGTALASVILGWLYLLLAIAVAAIPLGLVASVLWHALRPRGHAWELRLLLIASVAMGGALWFTLVHPLIDPTDLCHQQLWHVPGARPPLRHGTGFGD